MIFKRSLDTDPKAESLLNALYDSLPVLFMILNEDRRISFLNEMMMEALGPEFRESVYGKRPGEALDCESSSLDPGGCGCSVNCPSCGAFCAIMEALKGKRSTHECRFRNKDGESFDYRVWASPLTHNGKQYVTLSMMDIASEKRREALEKTFFQELTLTASGIENLVGNIGQNTVSSRLDALMLQRVKARVSELVDEISFTKCLCMAESGTLVLQPEEFPVPALLERVAHSIDFYPAAHKAGGKNLDVSGSDCVLHTDQNILFQVLMNLARNAVEADSAAPRTGPRAYIRVVSNVEGALFEVHNNALISAEKQNEIFKRSFSTKGKGRGLGAYSARLFAEHFLGGRIWFSSEFGAGTTFFVQIPNMPRK
jgi:hypothetical protein